VKCRVDLPRVFLKVVKLGHIHDIGVIVVIEVIVVVVRADSRVDETGHMENSKQLDRVLIRRLHSNAVKLRVALRLGVFFRRSRISMNVYVHLFCQVVDYFFDLRTYLAVFVDVFSIRLESEFQKDRMRLRVPNNFRLLVLCCRD